MDLPVMRTGRSLIKLFETRDAPSSGTERSSIRALMLRVQEMLADQGQEIDMASLQALLWFPEKDLYLHYVVTSKKAKPTDYEQEMIRVARQKGISKKEIEDGLRNKSESSNRESGSGDGSEVGGESTPEAEIKGLVKRDQYVRRTVESIVSDNGTFKRGSSKPYNLKVGKARRKADGIKYNLGGGWKSKLLKEISGTDSLHKFIELDSATGDPALFNELMTNAENEQTAKKFVVTPVSELENKKLFITEDGSGGFSLSNDGEIGSFFSSSDLGFSLTGLALAVNAGGTKIRSSDPVQASLYSQFGFKPVSKYKNDSSEITLMVFDPANTIKETEIVFSNEKEALTKQKLKSNQAQKVASKIFKRPLKKKKAIKYE